MSQHDISSRRSFLRSGALLAAPIAAVSIPAAALCEDGRNARIQHLENESAIRELHQSWLRRVNAERGDARLEESVRRITSDHAGAPDRLEIAADGRTAVGYFECAVEMETALPEECTLAQMAQAQGSGSIGRIERRMLRVDYRKSNGTWTIAGMASRAL